MKSMDAGSGSLEALRREIDEIDDSMHDLLMRRAEIVHGIGVLKGSSNPVLYRPEREAQLLRRLIGRHKGALPVTAIVRIWREILTASTRLQGNFTLAVFRSDEDTAVWRVAGMHFGSDVPATAFNSVSQVINAVTRGEASVGLLPAPQQDDATPWWPTLLGDEVPRVVARLPVIAPANATSQEGMEALVIARGEGAPSGFDRSLLVLEIATPVSRARVVEAFAESGLAVGSQIVVGSGGEAQLHLLDIADYVQPGDTRLAAASLLLGAVRATRLGGYAEPVTVAA
jgi:chorismate mutase / prephenate dehydratase